MSSLFELDKNCQASLINCFGAVERKIVGHRKTVELEITKWLTVLVDGDTITFNVAKEKEKVDNN